MRQKALRRGEDSGKCEKDTKQSRLVGEGGGKDRRRYIVCTVAILLDEKGMLIGESRLDATAS